MRWAIAGLPCRLYTPDAEAARARFAQGFDLAVAASDPGLPTGGFRAVARAARPTDRRGTTIRIWYQSFVDEAHGAGCWAHLADVAGPETEVEIHGITSHDSFAHALMAFRRAREVIVNAVRAEREGYDAVVVGHFQDAGLYEARKGRLTGLSVSRAGEVVQRRWRSSGSS